MGDTIGFKIQITAEHDVVWSICAKDRGELPRAHVNGSFTRNCTKFLCVLACLDWARVPPQPGWSSLRAKRGLLLPVVACRVIVPVLRRLQASADYRCFQVSNPCREIHSTAFVHNINLTDIHRVQKKGATDFVAVTFTNIDGFS